MIAKPGLDGHDRGAKVVVRALIDAGFEVIYTGLHKTVEETVEAALQEDVNVIGLSILSGAHKPLAGALVRKLDESNMDDVVVMVGGNIPRRDFGFLRELGIEGIFPTGSKFGDIVDFINSRVGDRHA